MNLHSKKDIYYFYKVILFSLLPLIIFGIIKNGFILYKETKNYFIIFKPVIYFTINIILGFILDFIVYKKKKINKFLVYLTIIFMISSINTPIWLFILGDLLLIILLFINRSIINKIALTAAILFGINFLLNTLSYSNILEESGQYVFSFIDLLFLRQIGGIGTANLILVVVCLIILLFNIFYKRNIALFGITTYIASFVLFSLFYGSNIYLKYLINSTAIFELIMIAPLNEYSPSTPKGEIVYGLAVGIIGAILCNFISPYIGICIAILLLTPFKLFLEKNKYFN